MNTFNYYTIIIFLAYSIFAPQLSLSQEKVNVIIDLKNEKNRIIEPTSPILGFEISEELRNSNKHPAELLTETWSKISKTTIAKNALAYFSTMQPGLDEYCGGKYKEITSDESLFPVIMKAAIPTQVLVPLFDTYLKNKAAASLLDESELLNQSTKAGTNFYESRVHCPTAESLIKLSNIVKKFCIKRCDKLIDLNAKVSSPEGSYPRLQFSINGFTRYVYQELLKIDSSELQNLLNIIYDLEKNWLNLYDHNQISKKQSFFKYVIEEAAKKEISPFKSLLVLAYSTRNMPSLDIEYTQDPYKAFILETYFWKFLELRNKVNQITKDKNQLKLIYPGKFKRDPGTYHFTTAALLSCAAIEEGFSKIESSLLGLVTKLGYKTDKFFGAFNKKEFKKGRVKYVKNLLYQQAFGVGVKVGWVGGKYASKVCNQYKKKKLKEPQTTNVSGEIEAEDLDVDDNLDSIEDDLINENEKEKE